MAMEAAQAEPWVQGSTGQLKAHPGFVVAARCDATVTKLALELRLLGGLEPLEFNEFDELASRRSGPDQVAGGRDTRTSSNGPG